MKIILYQDFVERNKCPFSWLWKNFIS